MGSIRKKGDFRANRYRLYQQHSIYYEQYLETQSQLEQASDPTQRKALRDTLRALREKMHAARRNLYFASL